MTSRLNGWIVALALALATLGSTTGAHADHDIGRPYTGSRPLQLDFHAGLGWHGWGFAGGARFGIPLMQNGFIPSIDNAVYLNFGADAYFVEDVDCGPDYCNRDYRFALGLPVALHWEFFFNDTWSAFAEIGVNVYFPTRFFHRGHFDFRDDAAAWFLGAVGGTLHLGDTVSLTLRVGNPYIAFGITLKL